MASEGVVDLAFVQEIEHRPKLLSINEAAGIPLIDLSAASNDLTSLVGEVGSACRDWGFFQVVNHGVPLELRQRIELAAKEFFGLSVEGKNKVRRDEMNPMGYYDTEHTKEVRDWKEVFDFTVEEPMVILTPPPHDHDHDHESEDQKNSQLQVARNQWPDNPPDFRDACREYAQGVEKLAYKLIELISLSLNLPAKRLNGFFKDQTSRVRLNHYPPCPWPHLALGVGRHKDSGGLTILAQDDVGGLDVKRKIDGEWVRVKPIPNSFIINVGDIFQVWSNDKYESVEHRVTVNSERERFSIPFFFNPAHYVMVKPLEELVNKQNPPKYREYNWWEFRMSRMNSNYKKLGVENLQIYHFKISE